MPPENWGHPYFRLLENIRPNGLIFSGELLETAGIHNSGYGNSWKLGASIIREGTVWYTFGRQRWDSNPREVLPKIFQVCGKIFQVCGNSHLFNYFVTFPVNFPFSRLKSCFSTLIELENETWVTDFCSWPKGMDKKVTEVRKLIHILGRYFWRTL